MHTSQIDVLLYSFTALTQGRVARGAKRLVNRSRIWEFEIMDDGGMSHLDPLSAAPARNDFLKSLAPFLRRYTR